MSNYYVSKCCGAEVVHVDPSGEFGRCLDCKEMTGIEVEVDND